MSEESLDSVLDDHFLGCALAAFVELAVASGRMPDFEATRRLAYRYYEEDLAEKNRRPVPSTEVSTRVAEGE